MSWLPIPPTLWNALTGIFSGSMGRIMWRLFVLAFGLAALGLLLATGSYIAAAVASMIVSVALSETIRGILLDIWYSRVTRP